MTIEQPEDGLVIRHFVLPASWARIVAIAKVIFVWDHRLMIVTTDALVSETLRALAVNALRRNGITTD